MIVSHRHACIFLHVPKTAGSSVAAFLARHLGPEDVMADAWDDALANGARYNRRFWKDLARPHALRLLAGELRAEALGRRESKFTPLQAVHRRVWQPRLGREYLHPCAEDVRAAFPDVFDRYLKFGVVRNPYSHIVSLWRWRISQGMHDAPFGLFLETLADPDMPNPHHLRHGQKWEPSGWRVIATDEGLAADRVARMESLDADLGAIFREIGLPPGPLPHAKNNTGETRSYRKHYGPREKELVERLYAPVFEAFDYAF